MEYLADWRKDSDRLQFVPLSHDQEQNQRIQKLEKQLQEKLAQSEKTSNDLKLLKLDRRELVNRKEQLSKESAAAEAEHKNARQALDASRDNARRASNAARFKAKIKLLPPKSQDLQLENKYFVNKEFNMKQSVYTNYSPGPRHPWYAKYDDYVPPRGPNSVFYPEWYPRYPENQQNWDDPDSPRSESSDNDDSWHANTDESVKHSRQWNLPKFSWPKFLQHRASAPSEDENNYDKVKHIDAL
jgi:hypothetical protein